MQIRCNLLHAADSYKQNIKMGGARMDTFDVIFTTYSPLASIRSMILFLARKYVTFAHDSDLPKMSAMSRKHSSPSVRSKNTSLYYPF